MTSYTKLIDKFINDKSFLILKEGLIFRWVESHQTWKPVKTFVVGSGYKTGKGYLTFHYTGSGYKGRLYIHRVIFRKFKGSLIEGMHINHIDGHSRNNHIDNLEQVTAEQNRKHAVALGLGPNPKDLWKKTKWAKINEINTKKLSEKSLKILERIEGGCTDRCIAKRLNISRQYVSFFKRQYFEVYRDQEKEKSVDLRNLSKKISNEEDQKISS